MVAMCDCLLELSLITVPTGVALAGTQISQLACFFLISYGPSAQMSMIVILFLMSLDRLISILFPIWLVIKYNYLPDGLLCQRQ
jgi:hypothetical protein